MPSATRGAANAALFAVAMLAVNDPALRAKLDAFRTAQTAAAEAMTLPPAPAGGVEGAPCPFLAARRRCPVSNSKNGDLPILPGATLGVLGGGQLGRMFAHAAQRMGYFTAVLDPDTDSPAGRVSHHHIHTDYDDVDGLARLAGLADAVTTEFENVPSALAGAPCGRAAGVARRLGHRHRAGPHRRKGPLHPLRRALRALCGHRDRGAARRR